MKLENHHSIFEDQERWKMLAERVQFVREEANKRRTSFEDAVEESIGAELPWRKKKKVCRGRKS